MNISRRKFVVGASAVGLGLLASQGLQGCGTEERSIENNLESTEVPVDVLTTDVLIVGSGIAGLTAAKAAMESNLSVLMLDKGPFGHSGASGINWGHGVTTVEYASDELIEKKTVPLVVAQHEGMCNQEYTLALLKNMKEAAMCQFAEQTGSLPERLPDGTPALKPHKDAPLQTMMGIMPRLMSQALIRRGLKVIDRTMVVDVALSPDGEVGGVVAIDLKNGDAKVFRSKAVVFAMGNYMWANGWGSSAAETNAGPEDTGDAFAIMFKHGIKVSGMEQAYFCPFQAYPLAARGANSGFCCPGVMWWEFGDKDGTRKADPLLVGDPPTPTKLGCQSIRLQMRVKHDEGALYGYPEGVQNEKIPLYTRRAKEDVRLHFGYELPDAVELNHVPCSSAAKPEVDTSGETPLKNLYWAGGGETGWLGNFATGSIGSGHMAGKGATQRALSSELPVLDWDAVFTVLTGCYRHLDLAAPTNAGASPQESLRPVALMHAIQKVMYEAWGGILRDESALKAGISELERIKEEDIPRMRVESGGRSWNIGWRQALEVSSLWDCVMGTLVASLARTETRGAHIRSDYPLLDNDNWLKDVLISKQDNSFVVELENINDAFVPAEEIRELLAGDRSMFE